MSVRRKPEHTRDFHGGDLADAMAQAGGSDDAVEWLDLSTGINPRPYPLPEIPSQAWSRLPGRRQLADLLDAAAVCYGAPEPARIVAGPGSQALIQALPACLPEGPVTILGPTYSGHEAAWRSAGRVVQIRAGLGECDPSGITVVVNPNNPDARTFPPGVLEKFSAECSRAGGWLVADEAFCDLTPEMSVAPHCGAMNLVVLRSFGKFFGLAGLRLGFAVTAPGLAERLARVLGPWAVSGPAIAVGTRALRDTRWQEDTRATLAADVRRLDGMLVDAGHTVAGGTGLFRLVETPQASRLFAHLLDRRIYVRRFDEHPHRLRFGLPGSARDWDRLAVALSEFAA